MIVGKVEQAAIRAAAYSPGRPTSRTTITA